MRPQINRASFSDCAKILPKMQEDFPALGDLKAGSEKAWTLAFTRLWPVAVRAAHSTSHLSPAECEEAASDAIRAAVDQVERIRGERELFAFVAVVARRKAISMLREKFASKRA